MCCCLHVDKKRTAWFVLGLEIFEIVLIIRVILSLLVLSQLGVVTVFHCLASALVRCLVVGCEYLPSLADRLSNFSEAKVLSFEVLSDFCEVCQRCQVRRVYDVAYG